MKKVLAMLLTFMIVMSASITAFGATTTDVDKTLESSVKFAYGDKTSFDVSESKDYYLYLIAGEYDEKIKESYFSSVKKALDGGEKFDIGTLGLIISNIVLLLKSRLILRATICLICLKKPRFPKMTICIPICTQQILHFYSIMKL